MISSKSCRDELTAMSYTCMTNSTNIKNENDVSNAIIELVALDKLRAFCGACKLPMSADDIKSENCIKCGKIYLDEIIIKNSEQIIYS